MNNLEVIEDWFRLYGDEVYNFLIYYTRRGDVEDLVQEVFIKAMRGLDHFREESSPKTWLFSIAKNVAIDSFRKKQPIPMDSTAFSMAVTEETPDEWLEVEEEKKELYHAIQTLNEEYRLVILFRALKEFSIAETAEALGWSALKVRVTYHRALKSLQKILGQREGLA